MKQDLRKFGFIVIVEVVLLLVFVGLIIAFGKEKPKKVLAIIETSQGNIKLELYKSDAPKTVENFVEHAKSGYYNNLTFHRVIPGFIIQGGDPKGDGSGGESIYGPTFDDEINLSSPIYETGYVKGVLAMANRGPNTNGSQFFITLDDVNPDPNNARATNKLDGKKYTIFGKVLEGQDVADKIAAVDRDGNDKPKEAVTIRTVSIQE